MRIPLDYYRILGLPLQATAEQLQQAHRDRTLQLPRREYSEAAITARKYLLDRAFAVLSDPEQRQTYDASFLEPPPPTPPDPAISTPPTMGELQPDPFTPTLEIAEDQLVGALLIFLELGEYELAIKLGRPHLSSASPRTDKDLPRDVQIIRADIALTVALACLELGREQWQQGTYEEAAESLETGHKLLLQEGLFPSVRGEIQADIYKLRPYRILELLALPEEKVIKRRHGLQMLKDMLQERNGIDGTGDDQSGLGIDDFLRFIQQLRGYLTSLEQQSLFEAEAQRPSAVATYLAVYALLARGFAYHQPDLIARAKRMLNRLATRQDVHLEQAVAALLMGQTEEASRALELSQEYEPLAFIREHSQGSPDLLPGLCLYGERWLQEEVFPHFRDLQESHTTLKDYFLDERVQGALEALPSESESQSEWMVVQQQRQAQTASSQTLSNLSAIAADSNSYHSTHSGNSAIATSSRSSSATIPPRSTSPLTNRTTSASTPTPTEKTPPPAADLSGTAVASRLPIHPEPRFRRLYSYRNHILGKKGSQSIFRLLLVVGGAVLALWLLWVVISSLMGWASSLFSTAPALEGEQLEVQLERPPIEIPDPGQQPLTEQGPLTVPTAKQVVQTWLAAKASAFGSKYQSNSLNQILVEPALSRQRRQAEAAQREKWYAQYQHNVTIDSVETSPTNPNQAIVEATVQEKAEFFENGQLDPNSSYNDSVRVQYRLIRKEGQWKIQDMAVI